MCIISEIVQICYLWPKIWNIWSNEFWDGVGLFKLVFWGIIELKWKLFWLGGFWYSTGALDSSGLRWADQDACMGPAGGLQPGRAREGTGCRWWWEQMRLSQHHRKLQPSTGSRRPTLWVETLLAASVFCCTNRINYNEWDGAKGDRAAGTGWSGEQWNEAILPTPYEFFGFVQAYLQILSFLEVSDWDDLALRHSSPKATYLEKKSMSKMRRKWSDLIISLLEFNITVLE